VECCASGPIFLSSGDEIISAPSWKEGRRNHSGVAWKEQMGKLLPEGLSDFVVDGLNQAIRWIPRPEED
jgi:hypothetical protein